MRTTKAFTLLAGACVLLSLALWRPVSLTAQSPTQPPAGQTQPQAPSVTFQTEVTYVNVDIVVTDKDGNFVPNLTRDDFEVFEDGKPQKIDTFTPVEIPIERESRFFSTAGGRLVPTDSRSNRETFSGRVFVLVLDDYNVSPMRGGVVKKSAREFVERYMGSNDLAAVVYTSGRAGASQDFTNDKQLLIAAIDKFSGMKFRSAALDQLDGYYQQWLNNAPLRAAIAEDAAANGSSNPSDPGPSQSSELGGAMSYKQNDQERTHRALNVLSTLRNITEFLSGISGRRKAVVYLSEGLDYQMRDVFGPYSASDIILAARDTISTAARANVNFYPIDPRGLTGLTGESIDMQGVEAAMPVGQGSLVGTFGSDLNTSTGPLTPMGMLQDELRTSQDQLMTLAQETGGFATINANNLNPAFERIVDRNSRYYVLGYYPPNHPRDGKYHRIEVKVKRPGLNVTSRRGYAAPRGRTPEDRKREDEAKRARDAKRPNADLTSSELRDVLGRPLQESGLTFTVQAAPFRGTQKDASVALAIEFDGDKVDFTPQDNNTVYASKLELSLYGISGESKAQGMRSELGLTLKPANYKWIRVHGMRVNPRMNLAPGRYQLRIGARESVGGRVGSVFYDLEVPDFRKSPLMLSGLLLTAASADDVVTVQPDPLASKLMPTSATSRRAFLWSDVLSVYAEVYDNITNRQTRNIDVRVKLISDDGKEVYTAQESLTNGGASAWTAYGYMRQIPLKEVPAGRYVLRVETQLRGATGDNATPAVRETVVTIRS